MKNENFCAFLKIEIAEFLKHFQFHKTNPFFKNQFLKNKLFFAKHKIFQKTIFAKRYKFFRFLKNKKIFKNRFLKNHADFSKHKTVKNVLKITEKMFVCF